MITMNRRTVLGLGALAISGCGQSDPYFGNTDPPRDQELTAITYTSGGSLDPALCSDFLAEGQLIRTNFEGITNYHPATLEPTAGIATHHELTADRLCLTFYLRGHAAPRGTPFPSLRPIPRVPCYWSDGNPITVRDVLYSWRRIVDPATAAPMAYLLYPIQNTQEINSGRLTPDKLGADALDDFTVRLHLRAPAPYLLKALCCVTFSPVPEQAIAEAERRGRGSSWTQPGHIVTNAPFKVSAYDARDRIVLVRNASRPEALDIRLRRVSYLFTDNALVGANLYKSGRVHLLTCVVLPASVVPALERKRDVCVEPAFGTFFPCFNVTQPPFDNVLVRYAFNMATDKAAIARVFGFGRKPARTLVPPFAGYRPPENVYVHAGERKYDVLRFDPEEARELLALAGYPGGMDRNGRRLSIDLRFPTSADARLHCEILQQQWRTNLAVHVKVTDQPFDLWTPEILSGRYRGVTEYSDWGFYFDPNWFLDEFVTGAANPTQWADPQYDAMLARANASPEPQDRMQRLAECEEYLLRAMPFIPEFYDVWAYPQKPYVRGIVPNAMDVHPLRYAWIDTNWRRA